MSQTPDLPPMPYAQTPMGSPTSEIFNRLLKDRIIILGTNHFMSSARADGTVY